MAEEDNRITAPVFTSENDFLVVRLHRQIRGKAAAAARNRQTTITSRNAGRVRPVLG
jgi:hypothetical protein